MKHYQTNHVFEPFEPKYKTTFRVEDIDTFGAAVNFNKPCCLNFASHKRPGGGYKSVIDLRALIRTQEEDLFRRSNLPELMDNQEVRKFYPLQDLEGFYTDGAIVNKGRLLEDVAPFEVSIVTLPAIVRPKT